MEILVRTLRPDCSIDFRVKKDKDGIVLNPDVVSKTLQSYSKEADINFIVDRARKTGFLVDPVIQAAASRSPLFGDFTNAMEYLECQNRVAEFDGIFSHLPADLRAKFDNDPSRLIDYLADSKNDAEAAELGLKPTPAPAPGSAPAPVPTPVPPVVAPVVPV